MDKNSLGLAGEYYVLAQLTQRGMVATLTLSNTKGVDILVTNQDINKLYKVEVKTTDRKPIVEKLFGKKPFYYWIMGEKHEKIVDKNLFYVFVNLQGENSLPKFFVVPSRYVARYVRWQHKHWLKSRKKKGKSTTMRKFRIEADDTKYLNNWSVFGRVK